MGYFESISEVRQACTLTAIERFAIERSDAKSLARFAR
jgi:hypothetical protein